MTLTDAALVSNVLSQLNVYWRTSNSSNTETSIPSNVESQMLCDAAPMRQRTEGLRHASA